MKLLRKLFGKKDDVEKKVKANEKALKKRNVKRGVGAAVGLGLSAYAGNTMGNIAKSHAESHVYGKAARKALEVVHETSKKVEEKARKGNLTEREAEFVRALNQQAKKSPVEISRETINMVKKNKNVKAAAEKAGKKAKLGVGLAIGGALAAHQIASTVKAVKRDRKETDRKNEKAREEKSKEFSKLGDVSKRVVKSGYRAGKKYVSNFDRADYNDLKSAASALISNDDEKKINDKIESAKDNIKSKVKVFSGREKVTKEILKKAQRSGVIQRDEEGHWRIISMKSGEYWDAKYETREKAEKALAAYHANRH